jgi:hypothetical protein
VTDSRHRSFDALLEALGDVKIQLWFCPEPGHSDSKTPPRQTVDWRDDVAYCLEPGCGRSSAKAE